MSAPPFDRLTPSLRAFAAGIALLWAGAALAQTSIEDQVTTATLDNGLEVVVIEDHRAPVVLRRAAASLASSASFCWTMAAAISSAASTWRRCEQRRWNSEGVDSEGVQDRSR